MAKKKLTEADLKKRKKGARKLLGTGAAGKAVDAIKKRRAARKKMLENI